MTAINSKDSERPSLREMDPVHKAAFEDLFTEINSLTVKINPGLFDLDANGQYKNDALFLDFALFSASRNRAIKDAIEVCESRTDRIAALKEMLLP